ncbi:Uncharacterised protein [Klebsiella pneumoniae]|uniref:Uncharacterized protein n=1 Tax=Klebsiella pneumoniae TaxID=573 RepID=A0A377XN81_KLEPN|nr:Uncharacterised protein [Klebsiella pneumoniae]
MLALGAESIGEVIAFTVDAPDRFFTSLRRRVGEVKDDSGPDTLAPALAEYPTISIRDFATIRALFMRPGVARRAMPTFG